MYNYKISCKYKILLIVDITDTIKLTEKYLTKLGMNENVSFIDANDEFSFKDSYDLIISNYAISECNTEVQKYYIENILSEIKQVILYITNSIIH